jgi:hypothetical protein
MTMFLIILGICIIPPILNILYMYVTVKYGLWNWVAKMTLKDGKRKMEESDIKTLLYPLMSLMVLTVIIFMNFFTLLYHILRIILLPFGKLIDLFSDTMFEMVNKMQKKKEFYDILDKRNDSL